MPSSLAEQSKLLNSIAMLGTGTLNIEVLAIPSGISLPWLVPKTLILDEIEEVETNNRIFNWKNQDIALYNLCEASVKKAKLLIVESVADPYRVGLVYDGSIQTHSVKLKDLKDVPVSEEYPYLLNAVSLNGVTYQIPALDKLSHELIDLDR